MHNSIRLEVQEGWERLPGAFTAPHTFAAQLDLVPEDCHTLQKLVRSGRCPGPALP